MPNIEEDRAVLNQQNKEYAESLAKDLARKEKNDKAREAAEQSVKRKKQIQEYRDKLKGSSFTGPLRVLVRYPNGSRVILGFEQNSSADLLFDAIISNPACPDFFSVRTVYPRAQINCHPGWYRDVFNAEVDEDSRLPNVVEEKKPLESIISNNSILFINMIH